MANGKAKTGAFSRRLGREKRVEHFFFHVRRHTGAVVANSDLHTIAVAFGRGRESRLVVATVYHRPAEFDPGNRQRIVSQIGLICTKVGDWEAQAGGTG